jgi:hypothetical protein
MTRPDESQRAAILPVTRVASGSVNIIYRRIGLIARQVRYNFIEIVFALEKSRFDGILYHFTEGIPKP